MEATISTSLELARTYRAYIDCLNRQGWEMLGLYVSDDVIHNGRALGLSGYRDMLESDYREIPDLRFEISLLVCEPPHVASRLLFDCTPRGDFLGLGVNGRRVTFTENIFYLFENGRIEAAWSILDKGAVEACLR